MGVLLTSISLFTHLTKIKSASLPRWFTPSIHHQLHKIHSLRKHYRCQPSSFNLYRLTSAECFLQLNMCDARVDFEGQMIRNFLSQKKDSSIFRYIRSCSGKPKLPFVMSWGSCAANTPFQIANLFNQYFHSVYSDSTLPVQPPLSIPEHSICSIELSQHDTFLSICSLNGDNAMGGDDIPPCYNLTIACMYCTQYWRKQLATDSRIYQVIYLKRRKKERELPIMLVFYTTEKSPDYYHTTQHSRVYI